MTTMPQTIGSICDPSNLAALAKAKELLESLANMSTAFKYFPLHRNTSNAQYYDYLLSAVLDESNPRVGYPSGDPEAAGVQNLVANIFHDDKELDSTGWTKLNGKIDERLFNDKRAWSCVRKLPRTSVPPSYAGSFPDLEDPIVSQVWDVLEPPEDYAERRNRVVCVNMVACVYFLREIFSSPVPADGEEHARICKQLQTIGTAAKIAHSALGELCCRQPPSKCEHGNAFRRWVTFHSVDPLDVLSVQEMVRRGDYLDSIKKSYRVAIQEHLLAIESLAAGLLAIVRTPA